MSLVLSIIGISFLAGLLVGTMLPVTREKTMIIVFLLTNAAAFCIGYHRGMGFIERNYEGFKHYVDSTLDELEIQKSKS